MAKLDSVLTESEAITGATEATTDAPPPQPAPDIPALETGVSEAKAKLDSASADFVEAGKSGDMKTMLESADAVKVAQRAFEKAQGQLVAATFSIRAAERVEFSVELRDAVLATVTGFEERARSLGITSVTASYGKEGGIQVNVLDSSRAPGTRTLRKSSTRVAGEGTGRGAANVVHQGGIYTGRDFLLQFGGEDGRKAVAKSQKDGPEGWLALGLTTGPGFDAPKRKLMKQLGATFEDGSQP